MSVLAKIKGNSKTSVTEIEAGYQRWGSNNSKKS